MTYEEFLESYLINKEEFQFYYKNKIVNICYGAKGTFAYNIVENNVVILYKEFNIFIFNAGIIFLNKSDKAL